jgi:hypothetical protein
MYDVSVEVGVGDEVDVGALRQLAERVMAGEEWRPGRRWQCS